MGGSPESEVCGFSPTFCCTCTWFLPLVDPLLDVSSSPMREFFRGMNISLKSDLRPLCILVDSAFRSWTILHWSNFLAAAAISSKYFSCPGFIPTRGTFLAAWISGCKGDNAERAREIPIWPCRMWCSMRSAPSSSSFASIRTGTTLLMSQSSRYVATSPHTVWMRAARHWTPKRYQSPPLNNPWRPFVVANGTGLSAKSPTAITPQIPATPCADVAPTGSSIPMRSNRGIARQVRHEPITPTAIASHAL